MKRYTTIAILMGAALLTHVSTASAQRWGREATPRSGVCFYEDINFGGRYFCSPVGSATESVPNGMNDRVSSVRVIGNAVVTIYRDPNLRGQAKVVDYDVRDMRAMGFNDRVSSYVVDNGRFASNGNVYGNNGNGNGNVYGNNGNNGNQRVDGNARARAQQSRYNYRDAETIVRRSYLGVLGRNPDPEGLRSWTNQVMANNWTERDLENALRQSDEYRAMRNNNGNGNGVARGRRR